MDEIRARKEAELEAEKSAEGFESIFSRARDCPPRAPFGAALRRAADPVRFRELTHRALEELPLRETPAADW